MARTHKNLALNDAHYEYLRRCQSFEDDAILAELVKVTSELGEIGRMQINEEQGAFFTVLVGAMGAKNAIEIGTFTGYSSICIARGLVPGGKLVCCDINDKWTTIAKKYWERANVHDRIELHLGPASETLDTLPEDPVFDFAFIDADKTGYEAYYEKLLPRMRVGGVLAFDNMLQHGRITNPDTENARVLNQLNQKLAKDERVVSVLIPIGDGIMLCRKM